MSEEYEIEIEKAVEMALGKPTVLKAILRNYDNLVKEKNDMKNLELPYWCYGFCSPIEEK